MKKGMLDPSLASLSVPCLAAIPQLFAFEVDGHHAGIPAARPVVIPTVHRVWGFASKVLSREHLLSLRRHHYSLVVANGKFLFDHFLAVVRNCLLVARGLTESPAFATNRTTSNKEKRRIPTFSDKKSRFSEENEASRTRTERIKKRLRLLSLHLGVFYTQISCLLGNLSKCATVRDNGSGEKEALGEEEGNEGERGQSRLRDQNVPGGR